MIKAEVVMVVNTHAHKDHSGGNSIFPGTQLIAGSYTREQWEQLAGDASYPEETIEPGREKHVYFDDEMVRIRNMGSAHSWNDCVVYLKNRKLLMTGDLVFVDMHPALFTEKGTSVGAWIAVLDTLPALFDIKTVVPGHGQKSGKVALRTMKEYFTSIRDALGEPTALKKLKDGYSSYYSLPGMSSFDITVTTLNAEKKQ
jgi:cyclase